MKSILASLSVAAGIALYELVRREGESARTRGERVERDPARD